MEEVTQTQEETTTCPGIAGPPPAQPPTPPTPPTPAAATAAAAAEEEAPKKEPENMGAQQSDAGLFLKKLDAVARDRTSTPQSRAAQVDVVQTEGIAKCLAKLDEILNAL